MVNDPSAQPLDLAMAPQIEPGRLGNLSPDQEAKLKEMWGAVLEIFGVAHDEHQTNGTAPAVKHADPAPKPKARKSLFGKKDKAEVNGTTGGDNDKHGQTKDFQKAIASHTPEELRQAFWEMTKHDHPDIILLRFLRARKWDVQAALVMLISTGHWRSSDMHVDDDIMPRGEAYALQQSQQPSDAAERKEGEDFMAQLRMGKSFLHGSDKEGRSCCYVRARLHHGGEQTEKSLERYTVYTIETARMLLRPPIETATVVFDLTDFSLANMDYTPVKFMIKCFEANYPESLGSVLVYKAPFIFRGIWSIIKGWLDPVVASKVHFASNVDELSEWIPRNRIMKELGGDEDYTYRYIEPQPGENAAMADTATRDGIMNERKALVGSFESETMSWISGEDAGQGRSRLAQRLTENYWKLDPYVRAKSLYDRQGVLGKDGKRDYYPATTNSELD